MIENWTDVYPAEQLLVISQEKALTSPGEIFVRVMRHIGAAEDLEGAVLKHALRRDRNQGPGIPLPPHVAAYLEQMFAGERQRLPQVLCERFPAEAISQMNVLHV
jgi:hypothetical protein